MTATDNAYSAKVSAAGAAVVTIRPFAQQTWVVQQVSTEYTTAPIGSTCTIRKNGSQVTQMIATGDVADGVPYTTLRVGDVMTVEWAGATPNETVKVYIVYDDGTPA